MPEGIGALAEKLEMAHHGNALPIALPTRLFTFFPQS